MTDAKSKTMATLDLTAKQREFWRGCTHRWNIKCGATRSGKTYLDYFLIPRRLRDTAGLEGLAVIMGATQATVRRNIIEPMKRIWGDDLVGDIRNDNTVQLFGERCFVIGADKVSQVDKVRGASIKYCYGDEVVTWHQEVFEMLKTRLDKPYSKCDATCNPGSPEHWLKAFVDSSGADIFYQQYTIFDNDFLDPAVLADMLRENKGIYYQRYILGQWVRAEGAIYREFADNEEQFLIDADKLPRERFGEIVIGQDFGGHKSKHAWTATAITRDLRELYVLRSEEYDATGMAVETMIQHFLRFYSGIRERYGNVSAVYADSAEQAIINSERLSGLPVRNSIKNEINDRIRATDRLLTGRRIHVVRGENSSLCKALREAVWDDKSKSDTRLDVPGVTNICPLDAFEYSWEHRIRALTA